MTKPQSPIHRPLDDVDLPAAPPTRIARLASLDQRFLFCLQRSLGPGGASAAFEQAVRKALIDEIAEQLREGPFDTTSEDGELRRWAKEIIEAFEGED